VPESTTYTDEAYKSGDTIWYSDQVAPVFTMAGSEMAGIKYTVNTGASTSSDMGRLSAMNGYAYPNRLTKVYDG
jgi:hypothetical protein